MKADKILFNGIIYTGLSEKPYGYLALLKNKVLAIGRGSGKDFVGRKTEIIDLRGLSVTPGLIDSHLHCLDYAMSLQRVKLDECASEQEVIQVLKEGVGRAVPGDWILGRGWSKKQFGGFPHKRILDEIFPANPVVLNSRDGHFQWVNSQTYKAAGLTTPIPVEGGYLGIDPDGSLNGIVGENAVALISPHVAAPDSASRKAMLLNAQNKLHEMGIVGFHNMDDNQAFGDLQDLHAESKLRLRVFHSIPLSKLEDAVRLSLKTGLGDEWFRFGFVKIFSDGALGSQSALMLDPYDEIGGTGIETIPEQDLSEKMGLALQNGIAVAVHAIGDRANRQVLNAFEKNSQLVSVPRARSRIEHAQLLHPDDIPRFQRVGIIASMQPAHAISDCESAERYWGKRAAYSYAWRALLKSRAVLIFGSDAPVESPDPLLGLDAATRRHNWKDTSQAISPFQAMLAYTWNPVVASGEEKERGSLERGKLADFVVFSDDPYQTPFYDLRIVGTALEGEFVYRNW